MSAMRLSLHGRRGIKFVQNYTNIINTFVCIVQDSAGNGKGKVVTLV